MQATTELALEEHRTRHGVALLSTEIAALRSTFPSMAVTPSPERAGLYDLTPGADIGVLVLGNRLISVRPKVDIERVFFLLSYTLRRARWLDDEFPYAGADSIVELIAQVFAQHLEVALARGVLQGYRTEEEVLSVVRGRIDVAQLVKRQYGRFPPIAVSFDEFTEDVELNRVLRAALARLLGLRLRYPTTEKRLRSFDSHLARVTLVEYDKRRLPRFTYNRLNARFETAVELALLILRSTSIEMPVGGTRAASFVVDMNKVFEDFVITTLRESLGEDEHTFPQGAQGRTLYLDRERRTRLEPDLSLWDAGKCVFVGDVKYKKTRSAQVPNADLYQLLAYITATGLTAGLLVYAAGEDAPGTRTVVNVGHEIEVVALDIGGSPESILREVDELATRIRGFATRARQQQSSTPSPTAA